MPIARPDVLVLAGGGTLGEAWMRGLLDGAGTAAGIDFRECEYFVGTSAGSIVASFLAAGRAPDSGAEARAAKDWAEAAEGSDTPPPLRRRSAGSRPPPRRRSRRSRSRRRAPAAPSPVPPRSRPRRATKRSMPGLGRLIDAEGARFDGRLRIVAVDRRNGAPRGLRRPRRADRDGRRRRCSRRARCRGSSRRCRSADREYVDGGVWSPTNLDAAPARRGSEVLCLNPTASLPAGRARALRAFSRSAAAAETLALRARGATVRTIGPDARAAEAMGVNLMDRGRVPQVLAAGYAQGRALAA